MGRIPLLKLPEYDPNYISADTFDRNTRRGYYGREELYKRPAVKKDTYRAFPEDLIIDVNVDGISTTITTSTNGYEITPYYFIGTSGTVGTGERIKRVDVLDADGTIAATLWQKSDGTAISPPIASDIIDEGRDFPVGSQYLRVPESGAALSLTVPSQYVTYALVQVTASEKTATDAIGGDAGAIRETAALCDFTLDGGTPSPGSAYTAFDGQVFKLDSFSQADLFRIISRTDSVTAGEDVRPFLAVTYYVGTSRNGKV